MAGTLNWTEIQRKFVDGIVLPDGTRPRPPRGKTAELCGACPETFNRRAPANARNQLRNSLIAVTSQAPLESASWAIAAEGAKVDLLVQPAANPPIAQVHNHLDFAGKEDKRVAADNLQRLMRVVGLEQQVDELATGRPTSISHETVLDLSSQMQRYKAVLSPPPLSRAG